MLQCYVDSLILDSSALAWAGQAVRHFREWCLSRAWGDGVITTRNAHWWWYLSAGFLRHRGAWQNWAVEEKKSLSLPYGSNLGKFGGLLVESPQMKKERRSRPTPPLSLSPPPILSLCML